MDQCQSLLLYLEDIVLFSSSVTQHLQRIEVVLDWLQREGLKVKLEKCAFFQPQVSYLGKFIPGKGVSIDSVKTNEVAQWPHPSHVSELC